MPVLELADLPRGSPLVGLDLGTKTIGVAVCDSLWMIASPLETIPKSQFTKDAAALRKLMDSRHAKGIVIGLPVNMDGSEGPRAQSARAFARNLLRLDAETPIAFWDERLSSAAVNRMMIDEMDLTRARRAEVVDKLAAAYILQGALDPVALAPSVRLRLPPPPLRLRLAGEDRRFNSFPVLRSNTGEVARRNAP